MFGVHTVTKSNEVQELVDWLASFGATTEGGVTRLLYSPAWVSAQNALKQKMIDMGLYTYYDNVGNLFGRVEGSVQKEHIILTGSHIDTVVQGGKYDGAYGIIASLLAIHRLVVKYGPPKKTVEVVSLCEEEGSRFPLTYWGSKNIMGEYSAQSITNLTDTEGTSFTQAMQDAGFPINSYSPQKRQDIQKFIEIHIEQGSILEENKKDIGLVSHIVGQKRFTITFTGESNHAGTTPMTLRKDAMVCTARAISNLTKLATEKYPSLTATVGRIVAKPNVPNVVAGKVSFTLDVRHHEAETIDNFCENAIQLLQSLATEHSLQLDIEKWTEINPVALDNSLHHLMEGKISAHGLQHLSMVSGAGHDAQVFGKHIPTTLLFVPSHKGISHSPLEFTNERDLEKGVTVLMDYLYYLAYEGVEV